MADGAMKMRLLGNWDTNEYCLLYADGTMTRFSTDNNDAVTGHAMTDLFTRYNKTGLTAYGENAERWQNEDNSNRIELWQWTSEDAADKPVEPYVAAEVVACNALDPDTDYMLLVKDPAIMQDWLKTTSVDYRNLDNDSSNEEVKYLTLKEYTDELNEVRKAQGLKPIAETAVRTKVARHQIQAVKDGAKWKIPSGTPWPADRRSKGSK